MTVAEELGNNGLGDAVDVSLDSLTSLGSTSPTSTLATIVIPFSSGPSAEYFLINGVSLDSGYYAIESSLATPGPDPNYQINFTAVAATPEPGTLPLVGTGLIAIFGGVRRHWLRRS